MDLVEVDDIVVQEAQALLRSSEHGVAAQVAAQDFGGKKHLLAAVFDRRADGVLGLVHLGGVDQGCA